MNEMIKFNNVYLNLKYTMYLSRYGKTFIEYNLDNGFTLGFNKGTIDLFCKEAREALDMLDIAYLQSRNAQFGTTNLVNPGFLNATAYGGLIWNNGYVLGNGVNGYIDTNFNPALLVSGQKYQKNNASRLLWTSNFAGATGFATIDGTLSPYGMNRFALNNSVNSRNINNTTTSGANLNASSWNGLAVIQRNQESRVEIITPDLTLFERNSDATSIVSANQGILRSGASFYIDRGVSFYGMGGYIGYDKIVVFNTAFSKLLNSNGVITPL